jgi:hypothetical protein
MKTLLVLAVVGVLGYYAYKFYTAPETCAEAFNHCIKTCRRTATEAPAEQACQQACKRDQEACASK